MSKITSLALIGAFSFAFFAPSAQAYARWGQDDVYSGTHPWDVRPRRHYKRLRFEPYRYSKEYFYMHPDRSKTYALHPYHRERYYSPPVDPEAARYSLNRLSDVRYAEENAYIPRRGPLASCNGYTYRRPNYRVPPYGYWCQQ